MGYQHKEVKLCDYCDMYGQNAAVNNLGVTQGGISRAINSRRDIWVILNDKGQVTDCYEIKGFGKFSDLC